MTELAVLTAAETDVLADCEETISHGLQTFVEVGTALSLIRDNRLYRASHQTFEAYCQDRWQISRPRAYELMTAAVAVSAMADNDRPTNERQARELARVPESERAGVWQAANDATDGKPTAAAIRAAAQPAETAVGADIPPTDADGEGPIQDGPVRAVAASPESTEGEGSGEVIPEVAEWRRRFHERAGGVREGRESYADFVADFPAEDVAIMADLDELRVLRALAPVSPEGAAGDRTPPAAVGVPPLDDPAQIDADHRRRSSESVANALATLLLRLDPDPIRWVCNTWQPDAFRNRDLPRVRDAFTTDGLRLIAKHLDSIADHLDANGSTL